MAEAGADALVVHLGPTARKNQRRRAAARLKEAAEKVQEICDAGRKVKSDIIFLCHGGPIVEPGDAAYIFQNTNGVHGFCGASSVERFLTEMAIKKQITKFKSIQLSKTERM